MNEYGAILVVLVLIYLIECVAWVPREGVAFRCRADRSWTVAESFLSAFAGRWHAVAADGRPGSGGIAVGARGLPRLSPEGVCARAPGETTPRDGRCFVPYGEIRAPRADGVRVVDGGRTVAATATAEGAAHLAKLIGDLARSRANEREPMLDAEMARLLDARAARRRARLWNRCARPLDSGGRLLAFLMFVALPVALFFGGIYGAMPAIVAAALVALAQIGMYAVLRRRLSPTVPGADGAWTMALTPPAAIRAADLLARDAFGMHHALALGAATCRPAEARVMASQVIRKLRHPLDGDDAPCCAASAWNRSFRTRWLEAWIERTHGPLSGLLGAPSRESHEAVAYCPRCLQQYVHAAEECVDCPGVRLRAFEA